MRGYFHPYVALWVEFAHIDACDLVRSSPLSHSQTSPRAERRAAERSGAERSGVERSAAEQSAAERTCERTSGPFKRRRFQHNRS